MGRTGTRSRWSAPSGAARPRCGPGWRRPRRSSPPSRSRRAPRRTCPSATAKTSPRPPPEPRRSGRHAASAGAPPRSAMFTAPPAGYRCGHGSTRGCVMRPDPTGSRFEAAVPGGAIVAQRAGVGDPALLLHGGPGLSEHLDELAEELRRARLSTVRFQQRGVAPSTREGPFDVARHVADAIAVLDVAGIERAWLIGHSWGGYLALQIASRHPERALGILAIGSLGGVGDGGAESLGPNLLAKVSEEARA